MTKIKFPLQLFIIAVAFTAGAANGSTNETAATPSAAALGCGYYQRGPADPRILDCRPVEAYSAAGYTVRRKIFIPVGGATAWHGRPVWTLSPPLTDTETINSLPSDAFVVDGSDNVDALSLRRLHQPDGLDLTALHRLSMLNRLELAETNATCLQRGLFDTPAWIDSTDSGLASRLVSLRLTDNTDLVCIQTGALDDLVSLAELSIRGSPGLKSLGGAPSLPALARLELPTKIAATIDTDATFCRVGVSLRYLIIDSSLALLWQPPTSLANISSLSVQPSPGETIEAIVQTLVLQQQAALCAIWPRGQLQLNGISIANFVADQLAMDYADEFCAYVSEAVLEYSEQAENRCSRINSSNIAVCDHACQSAQLPSPMPSTSASNTRKNLAATSATILSDRRDDIEDPATKTAGETSEANNPGLDRQGVIGTTLLTAGAFLGGALIAAYCCHSRRRMAAAARLKLTGGVTITGCPAASLQPGVAKIGTPASTKGQEATTAMERGEMEQIRLIGYTARLSDTGSQVVVLKDADNSANNGAKDATEEVKIVDEADEAQGDGTLLTAQL